MTTSHLKIPDPQIHLLSNECLKKFYSLKREKENVKSLIFILDEKCEGNVESVSLCKSHQERKYGFTSLKHRPSRGTVICKFVEDESYFIIPNEYLSFIEDDPEITLSFIKNLHADHVKNIEKNPYWCGCSFKIPNSFMVYCIYSEDDYGARFEKATAMLNYCVF